MCVTKHKNWPQAVLKLIECLIASSKDPSPLTVSTPLVKQSRQTRGGAVCSSRGGTLKPRPLVTTNTSASTSSNQTIVTSRGLSVRLLQFLEREIVRAHPLFHLPRHQRNVVCMCKRVALVTMVFVRRAMFGQNARPSIDLVLGASFI